jgi:hypothetical protein
MLDDGWSETGSLEPGPVEHSGWVGECVPRDGGEDQVCFGAWGGRTTSGTKDGVSAMSLMCISVWTMSLSQTS